MTLAYFSELDYETLCSGNYAMVSETILVYGDDPVTVPQIGDTLSITNDNHNGVARDFEVVGLADNYPHQISTRQYYGNSLTVILAADVFLDFFGEVQPMLTNIYVPPADIDYFESWIAGYTANQNPGLSYISRDTLKSEFDGLRTTYLALGGAMSLILAIIGILNFINMSVASVIARRRELAMLQSVGLTGRQLRQTLFLEGAFYTALTAFFTLTAGFVIGRLIVQVIAGQVWFFEQSFTVLPSVISLAPLLVICAAVPIICYGWLTRDSLVERLRVE